MHANLSRRLRSQVDNWPEREIINILIKGEYAGITYSDLFQNAKKYQIAFSKRGLNPGEVVILIIQHGLDLIYAYFGAILNGSIPSIMPYLTEKLVPEKYEKDLKSLIAITKPSAMVTFRGFADAFPFLRSKDNSIEHIFLIEECNETMSSDSVTSPGEACKAEEIVLLQHSSGTTGLQKGVALSHQAIFNQLNAYWGALKMTGNDVIVSWLPLYHDMGLIAGFLMPILYGIPLVLISPFDWVKAPHKLMDAITRFKGTLCWLPNFAYNFCAKKIRERNLENIDLSSMRAFINCSESMRKASHDIFYERFKRYGLDQSALATCYAMAENVFAVTQGGITTEVNYDEIDLLKFQALRTAEPAEEGELSITMVSGGRPIENTQVKIIGENGGLLEDRQIGEIVIQSDCMLTEYYNREDATKDAFIDGWFKTGDLGYIADRELYITGRKKDLIIVGGKNIYPKDLETIAMEVEGVHPGRVVAFGVYNEQKGTEDVVIIAEAEEAYLDQKEMIAKNIRSKVTQESAIALRNALVVEKKWLLKTSSGKIARALNREKYLKDHG